MAFAQSNPSRNFTVIVVDASYSYNPVLDIVNMLIAYLSPMFLSVWEELRAC